MCRALNIRFDEHSFSIIFESCIFCEFHKFLADEETTQTPPQRHLLQVLKHREARNYFHILDVKCFVVRVLSKGVLNTKALQVLSVGFLFFNMV